MTVTISIRFLTGRAHLHPWQTHHSEGRVEWPPSPWRLLRALVAVAGRGLTTLPFPNFVFSTPGQQARGKRRGKTQSSEPESPTIDYWQNQQDDCIKINRLTQLLTVLSATPTIWLPRSSGGHTRQYFPIHEAGMVKNTGSAVFDTFATVRKDQPLVFHWPDVELKGEQVAVLKLLLGRMTYFGRAESWCQAEAHTCPPEGVEGETKVVRGQTHWECVCIEDHGSPQGQKEYRDYLLERRLAPIKQLQAEVTDLLPRTKAIDGAKQKDGEALAAILQAELPEKSLLRCLLRESGQDIKDGLERPIGSRWVHYAVPRAIYDVPRSVPHVRLRTCESVNLVVYALNTATVHRPVLPPLTDTLLVADRFRRAAMALARHPGRALSEHEMNGEPCRNHDHAFWWPTDEDHDGLLDHVTVYACAGFEGHEIEALRRLTRLRQRGGRPDLLVTPIYVGRDSDYQPWQSSGSDQCPKLFVSATPYFCPVFLSRGRNSRSSRPHSITKDIRKRLRQQQLINQDDDVEIQELVFDYAPAELLVVQAAVANGELHEPVPPRQYFPVIDPPAVCAVFPKPGSLLNRNDLYKGCVQKEPDEPFTFGLSSGLYVGGGTRFIRSLAFCRRRRNHEVRGPGRMFCLKFLEARSRRPFAIGDQCHFGLGLFVPAVQKEATML